MRARSIIYYFLLIVGLKKNDALGFNLVAKLAQRVIPNYRLTWPDLAWFKDSRLNDVLLKFDEGNGFNSHRRLILQQLLRLTYKVPGDTAECGVYKGCGSYIILQSNKKSIFHRNHHIFDSFEGLSAPTIKDGSNWKAGDLSVGERIVKENLKDFRGVRFYNGWIPDRFIEVDNCRFSFVHIDVDLYQPTLDSISFFYDRINTGGILVCDDYGFLSCPGATIAIDGFLKGKPEKMVTLPGGGGFFIKGCFTSED